MDAYNFADPGPESARDSQTAWGWRLRSVGWRRPSIAKATTSWTTTPTSSPATATWWRGVAAEAASLAGRFRLGRLIVLYDANLITLSATTNITFSEAIGARFEAYGWHVQRIDGQDTAAVDAALTAARAVEDRPSLIVARTHIGYGSPHKQDTWHAHGEPLGTEETRLTKRALGWPEDRTFYVPDEALSEFRKSIASGAELEAAWQHRVETTAPPIPTRPRSLSGRSLTSSLPDGRLSSRLHVRGR